MLAQQKLARWQVVSDFRGSHNSQIFQRPAVGDSSVLLIRPTCRDGDTCCGRGIALDRTKAKSP